MGTRAAVGATGIRFGIGFGGRTGISSRTSSRLAEMIDNGGLGSGRGAMDGEPVVIEECELEVKSGGETLRSKRYEREADLDDEEDKEDKDPEGIDVSSKDSDDGNEGRGVSGIGGVKTGE